VHDKIPYFQMFDRIKKATSTTILVAFLLLI